MQGEPRTTDSVHYAENSQSAKTSPSEEELNLGVSPLDSLPAAWWNYLWNKIGENGFNTWNDLMEIYAELSNLIKQAGGKPTSANLEQVYEAIVNIHRRIATSNGTVVVKENAGSIVSSEDTNKVAVDSEDGTATVNGLGNINTLEGALEGKDVVEAINTLYESESGTSVDLDDLTKKVEAIEDEIGDTSKFTDPDTGNKTTIADSLIPHASSETTYGVATDEKYGHVKISDDTEFAGGEPGEGEAVAATPHTIYYLLNRIKTIEKELEISSTEVDTRNVPRKLPKCLVDMTGEGKGTGEPVFDDLNELITYVRNGDFTNIHVGDYIKMSAEIGIHDSGCSYVTVPGQYCMIAAVDHYLGNGDGNSSIDDHYSCNNHHLVMVPGGCTDYVAAYNSVGTGFPDPKTIYNAQQGWGYARMNTSNTNSDGYMGSMLRTRFIGDIDGSASGSGTNDYGQGTINQQLIDIFGRSNLDTATGDAGTNEGCLLLTSEYLSSAITSSTSQCNTGTWTNCYAVSMSEIETYGSIKFGPQCSYDETNACRQLPLFFYSAKARNNRRNVDTSSYEWLHFWLRNPAGDFYLGSTHYSASCFCDSNAGGTADVLAASLTNVQVRPRFLIG